MKYSFILFILLIAGSAITAQDEDVIRVYHGRNGSTGIFDFSHTQLTTTRKIKMLKATGDSLDLEVVNAHGGLYKYTISSDTFSIDYGVPDLSELVNLFNNIIDPLEKENDEASDLVDDLQGLIDSQEIDSISFSGQVLQIHEELNRLKSSSQILEAEKDKVGARRFEGSNKSKELLLLKKAYESYYTAEEILQKRLEVSSYQLSVLRKEQTKTQEDLVKRNELIGRLETVFQKSEEIKGYITKTDKVETIEEAYQYSNLAINGLKSTIDKIKGHELLVSLTQIQDDLQNYVNALYPTNTFDNSLFTTYINSIFGQLKKVKEDYYGLQSPYTFSEKVHIGNKPVKIYLSISSLSKSDRTRDIGKKLIEIEVVPFEVKRVELVPVLSMHSSSNVSSFEVRNGLISESEEDGFSFKPGLLLAVNSFYFGKYKEFSFGPSLGYSLDNEQQFLQNFNVGLLFSFQQKIRIGFGWGMHQYRSALTDKLLLGAPLPQDQTIDDVTKQVGRSTFSINFSLVGLSIFNK